GRASPIPRPFRSPKRRSPRRAAGRVPPDRSGHRRARAPKEAPPPRPPPCASPCGARTARRQAAEAATRRSRAPPPRRARTACDASPTCPDEEAGQRHVDHADGADDGKKEGGESEKAMPVLRR